MKTTPLVSTAEEIEKELKMDYLEKLKIGEFLTLLNYEHGWEAEENGIYQWPMIPLLHIIQFLMIDSEVKDLSDYKGSKAYSYFKQGWLGPKSYHCFGSSGKVFFYILQ